MTLWRADCFFLELVDGRETEKRFTIDYAADKDRAVTDAVHWVRNRQNALPELFGPLLAIKVYPFAPLPIEFDGAYHSPTVFPFYEWKCDGGKPLQEEFRA